MKSMAELLKNARELITDPAHWTQGAYAKNEYGSTTESHADNATCWCAYGVIRKVAYDNDSNSVEGLENAIDACATLLTGEECDGIAFNDSHTHAEVLQMFNCAIKRSETQPC